MRLVVVDRGFVVHKTRVCMIEAAIIRVTTATVLCV